MSTGTKKTGIVIIDKPRGPSSHQVAAWVGDLLGVDVGHAGTLDPMVSGVLVVMLGNAVRLAPLLLQHDKEYVALMRLHGDAEPSDVQEAARELTGRVYQRPPRRSAVKRALRIRTIQDLTVLDQQGRLVLLRIRCDAGTYIRSLCHHLGLVLGVGGHMQELRRTRSGTFDEMQAHTLHALKDAVFRAKEGDSSALDAMILPVEVAIPEVQTVVIRDSAVDAICHGAVLAGVGVVGVTKFKRGERVAVLTEKKEFVCLGRALVDATAIIPGKPGLVVAPGTVFMTSGTYPRCWKKHQTSC
ncbi:RNA-guided pseudouridylation complex pseudouridine synthase subunit Cbf5 [Methanosphaerula palustris]|uniref:Probable tRNA pseudouridine synthase B n=1 Tax=Methanosphaerula palustris (strain ATCC BAA-1556 / DSM 19958 / E1-9c) TaxID=521011 RepID=B8GFX9_METPE|nr:RNA-guided pseudouridylation complex pseudouridine synthase subunit Cbf5 [Methanosphaerula palustris]ACL18012.1 pseudouridylate synthase TruB domain protein [Methanosphaerula palustris E1-9c]